jgi:two-component system phosphate regulon sensor histidine kinase PhoR
LLGSTIAPALAAALGGGVAFALTTFARATRGPASDPASEPATPASALPATARVDLEDLVEEGVLVLDARRTVVYANRAAMALLGRSREETVGQPLIRAAWSSELAGVVAAVEGAPREVDIEGDRTVLASASHPDGDPSTTILLLREVSDSRRADRSRTELVANLSHELRTPIAAARALAETLESGVEDDERRERYQHQLLSELDRLGAIVERTLRLSRIESGVEPLDLAPQPPDQLLQAALQRLSALAEARDVHLASDLPTEAPEVLADFDRAVEVLTLLLDNAVKFSPPGETVIASVSPAAAGFLTFEVRDNGPGVLPAERARVFERLYTGDRARAGRPEEPAGFGLGLAIARHLVARMGGRIWVADVVGAGASFRFTLPLVGADEPSS